MHAPDDLRPRPRRRRRAVAALLLATSLLAAACGGGSGDGGGGASGNDAANDDSGTGGTLRIAMSAGNIPIPEQFQTEGGEGRRFVGVNVYDGLFNWDAGQGDEPPDPIPGLAESFE